VPSVCELLDRRCHEERRPFVPLVADAAVLRLGPIVVPGHGSCWGCWLRRFKQHAQWPAQRAALLQHYAARPDAGPRGHLEPFALLAAARLSEVIDGLDASCELAGRLWQMDMLTRDVVTSVVVGVHDCPRCGLRRSPPLRTVEELRRSLAYLWDGERLG
jgi:bacteriocin biosynthesis cyclodehydratase domain-containing protein